MKFKIRGIKHKMTSEICFNEKELKISKVAMCYFIPTRKVYTRYIKRYFIVHMCIHLAIKLVII